MSKPTLYFDLSQPIIPALQRKEQLNHRALHLIELALQSRTIRYTAATYTESARLLLQHALKVNQ